MSKEFRWSEGSQSFTFTFETEKVSIYCSRAYSECWHTLLPEHYGAFNREIDQSEAVSPEVALRAAIDSPAKSKIHMAIHNHARTDHVWVDMEEDWNDRD